MTTIKQLHAEWAARIMPADAPQVQRQEMERAFYSGAAALFGLSVGEVAALPDAAADAAFQKLSDELQDYFKLLGTIPGPEGALRQ